MKTASCKEIAAELEVTIGDCSPGIGANSCSTCTSLSQAVEQAKSRDVYDASE